MSIYGCSLKHDVSFVNLCSSLAVVYVDFHLARLFSFIKHLIDNLTIYINYLSDQPAFVMRKALNIHNPNIPRKNTSTDAARVRPSCHTIITHSAWSTHKAPADLFRYIHNRKTHLSLAHMNMIINYQYHQLCKSY